MIVDVNKSKMLRDMKEVFKDRYKDSWEREYAEECFMDGVSEVLKNIKKL